MKKIWIFLAFALLLTSCQNSTIQNPEEATSTGNITTETSSTGTSEGQSLADFPKITNSEWQEFSGNFGDKITLEKDFCINNLCLKANEPTYYALDGNIVQIKRVTVEEVETSSGETDEKITFVKYVEAKPYEYILEVIDSLKKEWKNPDKMNLALYDEFNPTIDIAPEKLEEFARENYHHQFIVANPHKNIIFETINIFLSVTETKYTKIGNILIKQNISGGCASINTEQHFFDENGNELTNFVEIFSNIPKEISYNGIKIIFDENMSKTILQWPFVPTYSEFDRQELPIISLKENNFAEILKNENFGMADYYYIQFEEYPNVYFAYKNEFSRANGYLTGSLADIQSDENGFVTSLEETLKIAEPRAENRTFYENDTEVQKKIIQIRNKDNKDNYIGIEVEKITKEMLPIFQIRKLENGDALLYIVEKYEAFTTAEFCKPVVYTYDNNSSQNSLSITLPQGGIFTKLIPNFSHENTWNFKTDNQSQIVSGNQNLDYLYYSVKVPNYTFNRDGWQVYGRDIIPFFEEKLDYIGFNAKEKSDFIDFWKTEFQPDQLYFVSFKFDESLDTWAKLDFARKPNKQIRVLLEAHPLKKLKTQFLYPLVWNKFDEKLLKKFIRSGEFDVLEWGGVVQKDFNSQLIIK